MLQDGRHFSLSKSRLVSNLEQSGMHFTECYSDLVKGSWLANKTFEIIIHTKIFKATLCRNWYFVWFGSPTASEWNTTVVNNKSSVCNNLSDRNLQNYKQNSLRRKYFMSWKLVSWSKHVCNAVIRWLKWLRQMLSSLFQDTLPSKWCWSC